MDMSDAAPTVPDGDEPADCVIERTAPRLRDRLVVEGCELLVLGTTGTPALLSAQKASEHREEMKRLTL
jgi:hypothetical protein